MSRIYYDESPLIDSLCTPYRGKVIRDNTATNQALFPALLYGNLALVQSRITGPNPWPWMVDYCAVHCGVKRVSTLLSMPRNINPSQCDPLIPLIPPVTTLRYLLHHPCGER